MKTFRIIFFTGMLIITNLIYSQEAKRPGLIKYDMVSLLGDQVSNSMGIMFGFEYFVKEHISFALDAMYIFPCSACEKAYTGITTEKTNGYLLSAETRHYIFPGKQTLSGFHLGPQIIYQYTKSEMMETYDGGIENSYQVYRHLLAAHAMAGYQLRIAGPVFFNPSLGLGFRYISSRNENKKGPDSGQHEYPYDKDYESGNKWFPSFTVNIKIGLKL